MGISKNLALAQAIRHQCEEVLGALSKAYGRREVLDYAVTELLPDELSRRAISADLDALSEALDTAGERARAILDRMEHVTKALES